ncbi:MULTISPECIES: fimbrial protein [Providencia]
MSIFKNKKYKKISNIVSVIPLILLPIKVMAEPHGSVLPVNGTYTFYADMNNQLMINEPNRETVFKFAVDGGSFYNMYCNSAIVQGPVSSPNIYSGMTFDLTSTMPKSTQNPGYLYLNEYFDVKVEIHIGGVLNQEVMVPNANIWNRGAEPINCNPPQSSSAALGVALRTGSRGTVTFRLKKPIINGIAINQTELVQVFARMGQVAAPTFYPSTPSTRVILGTAIVTVADECKINNGNPINIDFGDIGNTSDQVNGSNFVKPFLVPIECRGGSFTQGDLNIKLSLQPGPSGNADFNPDYFGTLKNGIKRTNLGIVIKDTSLGTIIKPNQAYSVPNFVGNKGVWNLTAAPIAQAGSSIDEGEFTATGTILAEFQ